MLRLIKGGLDQPIEEEVSALRKNIISEIQEDCCFQKEEVLGLIQQIAHTDGFSSNELFVEEEYRDPLSHLVSMVIRVKERGVRRSGWGAIWYHYVMKGKHHGGFFANTAQSTLIARIHGTVQNPSEPIVGGIAAEYKNRQWTIMPPQHFSKSVEHIKAKSPEDTIAHETRQKLHPFILIDDL